MIAQGGDMRSQESDRIHTPVLVPGVLSLFHDEPPAEDAWFVDGTVGGGGHARALLEANAGLRLFGLDQDPDVLDVAKTELFEFRGRVRLARGRWSELSDRLAEADISRVSGMLFDLGANSLHFDRAERGFSFQSDGPLDMRMDPDRTRTAADIVNSWDESDLADLFYYEGGEHGSRRVAQAIVRARRRVPFLRTAALADLIANTLGRRSSARIHPATRCFQALRRAVNEEGDELLHALAIAEEVLVDGAPLAIISFHEGEDRIVKRFFKAGAKEGRWKLRTKKPIAADSHESRMNPRARSAKLRVAQRIAGQGVASTEVRGGRRG